MSNILEHIIRFCITSARRLFLAKPSAIPVLPLATKEPHREGIIWRSLCTTTGIIWTPSKYRWPVSLDGTTLFQRLLTQIIRARQAPQIPQDHHEADIAAPLDSLSPPTLTTQAPEPASLIEGGHASEPLPVSGIPTPDTPQQARSQLYDPSSPPTPVLRPPIHPTISASASKASVRSQEPIAATLAMPQKDPLKSSGDSNREAAVSWLRVLGSLVRAVWAWLRSWFAAREEVGKKGGIFHVSELREILVR